MAQHKYGPGHIYMPDNSLLVPAHRQGPGGGAWPISAVAAPARYDNSAAQLWYKMTDAASPLVNSGVVGVRDLAYDAGTSDGQATYGVAGMFPGEDAIEVPSPLNTMKYLCVSDDTALFGGVMTMWVWVSPYDYSARGGWTYYLFVRGIPWGASQLVLSLVDTRKFRVTAMGTNYDSAANAFTYDDPHLFAATYDGAKLHTWIDGVQQGEWVRAAPTTTAVSQWNFGCILGSAKAATWGIVHEVGFDNTDFGGAKLLDMYNMGVP